MNLPNLKAKRGFSLLELSIAMAMMAVLSTSSIVLLRTSQTAWSRHRDDHQRRQSAVALLRHVVRNVRQAVAVTDVSEASDSSGSLSLLTADNRVILWEHNGPAAAVYYGESTAANLLAENIDSMTLTAYAANGSSLTTEPELIHSVHCTVVYTLNRPEGTTTERLSSRAWIRSW